MTMRETSATSPSAGLAAMRPMATVRSPDNAGAALAGLASTATNVCPIPDADLRMALAPFLTSATA